MVPEKTAGAVIAAFSVALLSYFICSRARLNASSRKPHKIQTELRRARRGLVAAIGNTPLIRINSLSDATGCEVSFLFRLQIYEYFLYWFVMLDDFVRADSLCFYLIFVRFLVKRNS